MKKAVTFLMFSAFLGAPAEAQISRVFAGINGNDANDCLQPATACRTLNGAITKVDAGGEVIVTETGSYAGATITKSVKLNVPAGLVAFSALPITVNAGATDVVVIRGLTLKALIVGSGTGLNVVSAGAVFIENSVIDGWSTGVSVTSANTQLFVKDSTIRNNTTHGIDLNSSSAVAAIDGTRFEKQSGGSAAGLTVRNGAKAGVTRSFAAQNALGFVVTGGASELVVDQTESSNNTTAGYQAAAGATLRLLDSIAASNDKGVVNAANAATVETFGNNVFEGNANGNTDGTITGVTKQ